MPYRGYGYGGDVADYAMQQGQQSQENWNNLIQLIVSFLGQKTAKEQWGQEFGQKQKEAEDVRQQKEKELGLQGAELPMKKAYYESMISKNQAPAALPDRIQEAVLLIRSGAAKDFGEAMRLILGRETVGETGAKEDVKQAAIAKYRRANAPTDLEQKMTRLDEDYAKGLMNPREYTEQKKALLSGIRPQTIDPMMLILMKQLGIDPAQFGMNMPGTGGPSPVPDVTQKDKYEVGKKYTNGAGKTGVYLGNGKFRYLD